MPRSRKLRRRPATPNFKVDQEHYQHPHTADPTSPPETPTTSPPFSRKISLKPRHQPDFHDLFQPLASDPNIRPVGDGHQFSYQPNLRPEQLSPRSSSSSSEGGLEDSSDEESSESASVGGMPNVVHGPLVSIEVDDEMDEDDEGDDENEEDNEEEDSEAESTDSESSGNSDATQASIHEELHVTTTTTTVDCNFTLEEVDVMDSDCDGLDVLLPTEIESNRSQSRERHRKDHNGMVHEFRNLNCSNETSDNEARPTPEASPDGDFDYDEVAFLRRRELIKKYRRMSMGSSFGKRTHSELSDSDDDVEGLDVHEVGSSARRLRRKLHRSSLLFHDPPPARIDELEEPDSSEDEFLPRQDLARELPYWTMEIMEMDSSPR